MPTKKAWIKHRERRRVAERVERGPQHRDLERPERDRADQRGIARAQVVDRVVQAGGGRGRDRGQLLRDPADRARAAGEPVEAPLKVGRHEQDQAATARSGSRRSRAGTTVIVNGASPGKSPVRRPRPQMITAAAYGK